jgi:hypothetical protein
LTFNKDGNELHSPFLVFIERLALDGLAGGLAVEVRLRVLGGHGKPTIPLRQRANAQ